MAKEPKELEKSAKPKLPDPKLYDEACAHLSAAVTVLGDLADTAIQERVSRLHDEMAKAKEALIEKVASQ